jgi:5-methyltetrahydropteroyltriglutamate--homocysteine methyltransferase
MARYFTGAMPAAELTSLATGYACTGPLRYAGAALVQADIDRLAAAAAAHDMTVSEYRRYAALRVEALNHALRGIPPERVRLHVCWGSGHGPHRDDIPLRDIIDLVLSVPAGCYSIEAANPRHEHEWTVWEDVRLPDGASLMPGVVGHATDIIEHPELVAQRLLRFAKLVGAENVIAGTDCGLGNRVGHPEIVWAKLEDLSEGARIASRALFR